MEQWSEEVVTDYISDLQFAIFHNKKVKSRCLKFCLKNVNIFKLRQKCKCPIFQHINANEYVFHLGDDEKEEEE